MSNYRYWLTWLGFFGLYTEPALADISMSLVQQVQHRGMSFRVASIPLEQYTIDLINEPKVHKVASKHSPFVMMNAGMFHPDHTPVGLQIIDGTVRSPINMDDGQGNFFLKPNGVFAIGKEGAVVQATKDFDVSKTWRLATQSGPLLLQSGEYHPKIKPDSPNLHIRNGVCVSENVVHFVISNEPVRFYDLASLMKEALGCQDGLYLDGAVSKLYHRTENGWSPRLGRKSLGSWLVVGLR